MKQAYTGNWCHSRSKAKTHWQYHFHTHYKYKKCRYVCSSPVHKNLTRQPGTTAMLAKGNGTAAGHDGVINVNKRTLDFCRRNNTSLWRNIVALTMIPRIDGEINCRGRSRHKSCCRGSGSHSSCLSCCWCRWSSCRRRGFSCCRGCCFCRCCRCSDGRYY